MAVALTPEPRMPAVLLVLATAESLLLYVVWACCAIAARADKAMGLK